jgi:hypothetical protein
MEDTDNFIGVISLELFAGNFLGENDVTSRPSNEMSLTDLGKKFHWIWNITDHF